MILISNDDDAYLAWLETNPDGFVVNVEDPPRPSTLRLHRSGCRHISTPQRSNWTTTSYMKVCSNIVAELDQWANQTVGELPACASCQPRVELASQNKFAAATETAIESPFQSYPMNGRGLLGRRSVTTSRRGYGLALRQLTGLGDCAYCGLDLFGSYEHWLLLQVDHVVPTTMGKRLGIPFDWLEDYANLVLACSACNTFANQFDDRSVTEAPKSVEQFFDLRDKAFVARRPLILGCQKKEREFFDGKPWVEG